MIEVHDLVRFSNEALRFVVARAGKHRLMRGKQRISRVINIIKDDYRDGVWERIVELDCPDILHPDRSLRISVTDLVLYKKHKHKVGGDFQAVLANAILRSTGELVNNTTGDLWEHCRLDIVDSGSIMPSSTAPSVGLDFFGSAQYWSIGNNQE